MENLIEKLLLNKYLTVHTVNKMKLDKNYIKEQLIKVGLKKGDTVLVHSQLLKVGIPEEDVFDLGKYYLDIILEIIGDDGELVLPAFTYSYCKNNVFSPLKDMSSVSELANTCIRNHIGYRTLDPIFSYVIVNPKSRTGPPWGEVQAQVKGKTFLCCRCVSEKLKVFGPLSREGERPETQRKPLPLHWKLSQAAVSMKGQT